MSRIEAGKSVIREMETSLPELLHDLMAVVQPQMAGKELRFEAVVKGTVPEIVTADRLKLGRILVNLLGNAVKYTEKGGRVSLTVSEEDAEKAGYGTFTFVIRDTGIGMSEDFQKRIFTPFEREKSSTVSGTEGTGLGLAITKNFIEMMGGSIAVKSTLGEGSEFTVTLPLKIVQVLPDIDGLDRLAGRWILYCTADAGDPGEVASRVVRIGLAADIVHDRKEILSAIGRDDRAYAAVIANYEKGCPFDIDLIRTVRSMDADLPIVIASSLDLGAYGQRMREAGVGLVYTKPMFASDFAKAALGLPQQQERKQTGEEEAAFRAVRLLLVEDNPLNREIALTILQKRGFRVDTAGDGAEAVRALEESRPGTYDAVLMDVQMPVMDGYEATKKVRASWRADLQTIPIIAMTANAFDEDRQAALAAGMNAHIAKPLDPDLMVETIRKFVL